MRSKFYFRNRDHTEEYSSEPQFINLYTRKTVKISWDYYMGVGFLSFYPFPQLLGMNFQTTQTRSQQFTSLGVTLLRVTVATNDVSHINPVPQTQRKIKKSKKTGDLIKTSQSSLTHDLQMHGLITHFRHTGT